MPLSPPGLFPAVGLHSLGEEVRLHLPPPGPPEDEGGAMLVDSLEEEWGRLHDVRLCGSVSTRGGFGGPGGRKRGGGASPRTGDEPRRELRMRVWGGGGVWERLDPLPGLGGQDLRLRGEGNWGQGVWVRIVLGRGREGSAVLGKVKWGAVTWGPG